MPLILRSSAMSSGSRFCSGMFEGFAAAGASVVEASGGGFAAR
jgi:hypothetical protein